jgi:hypothetical protein
MIVFRMFEQNYKKNIITLINIKFSIIALMFLCISTGYFPKRGIPFDWLVFVAL